jgi:protein-disulfide isomerase
MTLPIGFGISRFGSGGSRFRRALPGFLACVMLSPFASAEDPNSPQTPAPLATFAGQPINDDQLPVNDQMQLQRMMQQVWGVKRKALQTVLNQKLIEAEAKKKGVGKEDLLKSEVDSKVADPSDDEVSAYYKARQDQYHQPLDEVRDKIRQDLKIQAILKARAAYAEELMQQAVNDGSVVLLVRPPKVDVPADPARLRGDPKAPVTIVEFSDFSCPFCRKAETTIKELLEKYQGQVKLGFRDFPLTQLHPKAELAAEASRCAEEQGKYWEYHDLLFAEPDKQGRDDLIEHARTLKLDDKQFDACLSGGKFKRDVVRDMELGMSSGVSGTPGFFVNGAFLNGAQPAGEFEKIIDQALASAPKAAK